MAKHTQEEMSGTEREAEQEKYLEDGVTPSVTPRVPKPSNFCLFCTGHSIHGNLPIACSGKYCLIQSKQLNGISFPSATLPKNPVSESFWTAPIWLWLDQMASGDIYCSIKPFCIYDLWFLISLFCLCTEVILGRRGEENLPRRKLLQCIVRRTAKCFSENELLSHVVDEVVGFYQRHMIQFYI